MRAVMQVELMRSKQIVCALIIFAGGAWGLAAATDAECRLNQSTHRIRNPPTRCQRRWFTTWQLGLGVRDYKTNRFANKV